MEGRRDEGRREWSYSERYREDWRADDEEEWSYGERYRPTRQRDDDDRRRHRSPSPPRHRHRSRSRSRRGRHEDHRAFPQGYVEKKRIFVGGVPKKTTEERFRSHFERFGALERVELNAERSFGFVTFAEESTVDACLAQRMQAFNHTATGTAFIEVRRPRPRRFPLPPPADRDS